MGIFLIQSWRDSDYEFYFRVPKKIRNANQLRITSSGKDSNEESIDMSLYSGVVEYFPEELVITLKAGTKMSEVNQALAKNNQALPFFIEGSEKRLGLYMQLQEQTYLTVFLEYKLLMAREIF